MLSRDRWYFTLALATLPVGGGAAAQTPQYTSPSGVVWTSQRDTGAIARAESALAAEPRNVDRFIQLGLAQAAVRQYREAIVTFTRALAVAPDHPVLYRHRGHRYLSVRQLDSAVLDLERGAHLDTANHDIWYHLGVARFARGEYAEAVSAFEHARGTARNAEGRISSTDWLWMSLRRAGRTADAALALAMLPDRAPDGGAAAYWRRLQLYQGLIAPDQVLTPADTGDIQIATLAFGIGNWHLVHGDTTRAREWFRRSVASGGWPAFGFICAEADLRRLGQR